MSIPLNPKHRRAINYYLMGSTKRDAVFKAGLAKNSAADVFGRQDVKEEIERRVRVSEKKTDMDREWLLGKLRDIIEASPGDLIEVDQKGRPSLNWNNMTPQLRSVIGKVVVDTSRPGGKYQKTKTHVQIQTPDRISAIKEAAQLLGLREEKHKIDASENLIRMLQNRREQLAGGEEANDQEASDKAD